jgi:hypothetical protein
MSLYHTLFYQYSNNRLLIWLMYFLYKNENKIFKHVEITIRRGLR